MDLLERLKRVNLVTFLSQCYGMSFRGAGSKYVAFSPFGEERRPSFYVGEEADGHWVYKDHHSGSKGTIIDFVRHKEGVSFQEAVGHAVRMAEAVGLLWAAAESQGPTTGDRRRYDIEWLYARFRAADASPCRAYLLGRGLNADLVEGLIANGTVVLNRYKGRSYCCFAVRDGFGKLRCLCNRQIDGAEKRVLGARHPFSLDWEMLSSAPRIHLCEGVIDYLSLKTLDTDVVGMALLGRDVDVEGKLFGPHATLVSAFDSDAAGTEASLELADRFKERRIEVYDLAGLKDPNELLQWRLRRKRGGPLSPEEKLELYRDYVSSSNKSDVARRWNVNRGYMYELVESSEKSIVEMFGARRPGRPATSIPKDLAEARLQLKTLEKKYEEERAERERLMCRSEFLALRLKWAEQEGARGPGQEVDEAGGRTPKAQPKKKEKAEVLAKVSELEGRCAVLGRTAIIEQGCFSRSQVWAWGQEIRDRKERGKKPLPESTVEQAAELAGRYPWLGGRKAKAYMAYHGLGVIGEKAYDRIRDNVKRAMVQELSTRKDFEREEAGPKDRGARDGPGKVWGEDFTELWVRGVLFKVAVLIDTFHRLYLGWAVSRRADAHLVSRPVEMALVSNGGKGPEEFLLSDRGRQYTGAAHEEQLSSHEIVHRLIPACRPDYNPDVESEMRLIKSLFHCVWEERLREQGEPHSVAELEQGVRETLAVVFRILNERMPRPYLNGVTPSDVQHGLDQSQADRVAAYVSKAQGVEVPAWTRGYWDVVKGGSQVKEMSTAELRTKLAFHGRSPLRRIAKLNRRAELKGA